MPSEPFVIAKIDEAERLVFGYASIAVASDGETLTDVQDDQITPEDLEKAAYDFVLESREVDEMHAGPVQGQLVESFVVTPEKLEKMGLARDAIQPRWWVGFHLSPEAFAKVQAGEYRFFSISGTAEPVAVTDTEKKDTEKSLTSRVMAAVEQSIRTGRLHSIIGNRGAA